MYECIVREPPPGNQSGAKKPAGPQRERRPSSLALRAGGLNFLAELICRATNFLLGSSFLLFARK
jgi:hypothetical protein